MGRSPCCDKSKVKRGTWSPEEDAALKNYLQKHGTAGNWIALPHKAGLQRCGKSCRLRWLNYLRPDIKHGAFTHEEENIICNLYGTIGSRWSVIASNLPGRTDNDVKNYWNTKLKKKLIAGLCNTETSLATAASDTSPAATTTTGIADDKTIFQLSPTPTNNSLVFPPTFLIPSLHENSATGLVNSNFQSEQKKFTFPRFILEESGSSSGSKSCPVPQSHQDSSPYKPLSLGMDENYGVNEIPMDEVGLSGNWSQDDGAIVGADNNADLFSIFSYPKAQEISQSNY